MTRIFKFIIWLSGIRVVGLVVLSMLSFTSPAAAQSQEGASRQIGLDEFIRARPAKSAETPAAVSNSKARTRKRPPSAAISNTKRPTYRRASGAVLPLSDSSKRPASNAASTEELGLTLWRLRPSKQNDSGARLLVMESSQPGEWSPERMEVDTP